MKRRESAASEVIGAVLLVSLVVIGGAVIAAFVFGQPTPKELPDVNFGVYKEDPTTLVLHHTGGDSLLWDEYSVYINPVDGTESFEVTPYIVDKVNPWSSGGDMKITDVPADVGDISNPGSVILAYKGNGAGETVLRKVVFEDVIPPALRGKISGHKYEIIGNGNDNNDIVGFVPNVEMILLKKNSEGEFVPFGDPTRTSELDGSYVFSNLPADEETYIVKENLEALGVGWEAVKPNTDGTSHKLTLSKDNPTREVDFKNRRVLPTTTAPIVEPTTTLTLTITETPTLEAPTPTLTPTPTPTPEGGEVIYLDKRLGGGGYLVGGTYFQGEAGNGDFVEFGTGKDKQRFEFYNGDIVRFTIDGDQNLGRFTIREFDLVEFSFRVTVQKYNADTDTWDNIPGAAGVIDNIKIKNINKNIISEESTLTYRHPSDVLPECETELRLNGEVVIPRTPLDDTPLEFKNMHIVHDNRYHEGLNVMWIYLEEGYNNLLVQGDYVYPP